MQVDEMLRAAKTQARGALISAIFAVIGACVAIPGAVYAAWQVSEVNASAKSAADSLKQAENAVAEARRFADAAQLSAESSVRIADDQHVEASHMGRLADSTDEARKATEMIAQVERDRSRNASLEAAGRLQPRLIFDNLEYVVLKEGERPQVVFDIKNLGDSDPSSIRDWSNTSVQAFNTPSPYIRDCTEIDKAFKWLKYREFNLRNISAFALSHDDAVKVDAGKSIIYSVARVCYEDKSGRTTELPICIKRLPSRGQDLCVK